MMRTSVAPMSAEGKCVGLHAGIEEPDLERVIGDNTALPDELIKSLPGHDALAVGIDIRAVAGAGWRAVDRTGLPSGPGPRTRCRSRAWNL